MGKFETGIPEDDALFMARFESNLAMERRPLRKTRSRKVQIFAESLGWAVAFAALVWMAEPWLVAYWDEAMRTLEGQADTLGLSPGFVLTIGLGFLGLGFMVWPVLSEKMPRDLI